jgi:serine/threonine protein phosphatase 1
MCQFPFKFYNKNPIGRDFVVGDLHGMFSLLESQLESLNFSPEIDRVFSVGDLIDRGPESYRVLEFLDKPWFHAIKGNHEMMLIEAKHKKTNYGSWIEKYGGAWWEDVDPATQDQIRERLEELPVALEIENEDGNIGVVHADVPVGLTWQEIIHDINNDEEIRDYLMWSRNRYKYIQLTGETVDVEGIRLVVMGHMPASKPLHVNNVYYIDTGAAFVQKEGLGHLTLLQISPEIVEHRYPEDLV